AVYRIISGEFICKVDDIQYIIKNPSSKDRYRAELLYESVLEEYMFEEWMNEDNIIHLLINNDLWTFESDKNLKEIEKRIDKLKADLFNNLLNFKQQTEIRKTLKLVKNKY